MALIDRRDRLHPEALDLAPLLNHLPLATSEAILIEVLNYFSGWGPESRSLAQQVAAEAMENPEIVVQPISTELFLEGLLLYGNRPDKNYSVTDCISMLIRNS